MRTSMTALTADDWKQLLKVLHYVRDNPSAHPDNIRNSLMDLLERMKGYENYEQDDTFILYGSKEAECTPG